MTRMAMFSTRARVKRCMAKQANYIAIVRDTFLEINIFLTPYTMRMHSQILSAFLA